MSGSVRSWKCFISIVSAFFVLTVSAAESGSPEFLEQNWSNSTRQKFYTLSQGSQLMSYDWFLALERADSEAGFFADGLRRHGYIPNPPSRRRNPDGLPVGFVLDVDKKGWWVGLTCAACHTSQIEYDGITLQIDGAPTQADMYGLITDIRDSVGATVRDRNSSKFERFARRVLRRDYSDTRAGKLFDEVRRFAGEWSRFVEESTTVTPWGPARLDAFGMIFNRVANIDLGVPSNNAPPDAPVSYPFLWGTSWEDRVQWNGTARNENDFTRLGRNVGEVLGVFAKASLKRPDGLKRYYKTTANRLNLLRLEEYLKDLWSPKWPENILGEIDQAKAEQGKALFLKHCESCHTIVPHGKQETEIDVTMTPVRKIRTDPKMAENACKRMVDTAHLEGVRMPPRSGTPLPKNTSAGALLKHVVAGAILAPPSGRVTGAFRSALKKLKSDKDLDRVRDVAEKLALDGRALKEDEAEDLNSRLSDLSASSAAASECGDDHPLMAYKGRPLDGIWATAPYMHNGSVANLYEMLLPAEQRMKTFHVGSRNFDPKHVGFEFDGGPGTFLFDTSKPGNSNTGHVYGNGKFTSEQRDQLVEYMKTL